MTSRPTTSANAFATPPRRRWWQRWLDNITRESVVPGPDVERMLSHYELAPSGARVLRRSFALAAERHQQITTTTHLLAALLFDDEVEAQLGPGVDVRPVITSALALLDGSPPTHDDRRHGDPGLNRLLASLRVLCDRRRPLTAARMLAFWLRIDETVRQQLTAAGLDELHFLRSFADDVGRGTADDTDAQVVVRLHNDDFTTQEFVTAALREVFELDEPAARAMMLKIHEDGSAVAWRGDREIAIDMVTRIEATARDERQPLRLSIDRADVQDDVISGDPARPSS